MNPVTQAQVVQAVNAVLATMDPPAEIDNLDTALMSDPGWSCNEFGPDVLTQVCAVTGTPIDDLTTTRYDVGAALPDGFPDATFVNISMLGEPSALNHNVNILVSDGTTYLIQAFVGQSVPVVRRLPNADFLAGWGTVSGIGGGDWQAAYADLFGIAPGTVVPEPPQATWLAYQYVTL
jgi:hypothetical protein